MRRIDKAFFGYNVLMVAAGGAILLAIAFATFLFSQTIERQSLASFRAGLANRFAANLLIAMLDAETGQRGYLLTHDARYLEPFRSARQRSLKYRDDLQHILSTLPHSNAEALFKNVSDLADKKFAELDATIARADAGDFTGAAELVKSDRGRSLMDEIRANIDELRDIFGALREKDVAHLNSSAAALRRLTTLGAAAIVLLTVLALASSTRHARQLNIARAGLTTANEQLEVRVQERTRELMRANDEIQRYAYIVSHDLRAPLINITGFTSEISQATQTIRNYVEATKGAFAYPDMAQVVAAIDEDVPEALRFIQASLTRMDNLISEILRLSRLGRAVLTPERINTAELALNCLAHVRHQLDEAGGEAVLAGALPNIVSDRNALEQIFTNLLDNAVKFFDKSRPGRILIRGRLERGRASFEIVDNGRGVKSTDLERIFELFRRSGVQDTSGEGIGLAHVRMLVRRLGGDIDATSDGTSGTVFRFSVAVDLREHLKEHGHG